MQSYRIFERETYLHIFSRYCSQHVEIRFQGTEYGKICARTSITQGLVGFVVHPDVLVDERNYENIVLQCKRFQTRLGILTLELDQR